MQKKQTFLEMKKIFDYITKSLQNVGNIENLFSKSSTLVTKSSLNARIEEWRVTFT